MALDRHLSILPVEIHGDLITRFVGIDSGGLTVTSIATKYIYDIYYMLNRTLRCHKLLIGHPFGRICKRRVCSATRQKYESADRNNQFIHRDFYEFL